MLDPLQNAPSFFGLIETVWTFIVVWLIKYWWAVVIALSLWYVRAYRTEFRRRAAAPSISAVQRMTVQAGALATLTTKRVVALLFFASLGVLWIAKSVGTLLHGLAGFEPVIWGNVAAIFASLGAGIGFPIRPWMVALIFAVVVFLVVVAKMAKRQSEEAVEAAEEVAD